MKTILILLIVATIVIVGCGEPELLLDAEAVDSAIANLQNRAGAVEDRTTSTESRIGDLENDRLTSADIQNLFNGFNNSQTSTVLYSGNESLLDLEIKVDENEDDITDIKEDIDNIEDDIRDLDGVDQGDLDDVEDKIDDFMDDIMDCTENNSNYTEYQTCVGGI